MNTDFNIKNVIRVYLRNLWQKMKKYGFTVKRKSYYHYRRG